MVIPADWKFVELGAVVTTGQLGGNYPNSSVSDGFPLIKMGNLGRGKIDLASRYFLSRGLNPSSLDILKPNDVLFNTRNTLDLVGKVAIWRNELPMACFNSNIMRLSFDSSVVCNEYANYALNTSVSIKALREVATGTTSVAAIYGRDLWLLPFLLPPLKEQEAIAEALSDADAAIESLDALIAKKRDVKQATMQQLLTGRTRLPGFTSDWKEVCLGEIITRIYGGGTPSRLNRNYWGNEIPWATVKDIATFDGLGTQEMITRQGLEASASQLVPAGTLIVCTRMAPGSALIFQTEVAINQDMKALICSNETKPEFLRLVLNFNKKKLAGISSGSTVAGLGIADLTSLRISLPPLKEQEAIAEALTVLDDELGALIAQVSKLRMVKQGMMQDLLTGKVRLM